MNEKETQYPVYTEPLNEARTSNRSFEEILKDCKDVRTLEEFERDFMKELDRMAKKYGVK